MVVSAVRLEVWEREELDLQQCQGSRIVLAVEPVVEKEIEIVLATVDVHVWLGAWELDLEHCWCPRRRRAPEPVVEKGLGILLAIGDMHVWLGALRNFAVP